jgi:pantoate kinase
MYLYRSDRGWHLTNPASVPLGFGYATSDGPAFMFALEDAGDDPDAILRVVRAHVSARYEASLV